ncbi:CBO0543 family protein [Niallia sp. JL1B1071]|uniref:CBO0543 family protein n=1 Tax=Niallia tiangongensis TaxID=3237105 RepID=UPI0037DCFEA5
MHLLVNIVILLLNWKYRTVHKWREYHTTMLFISLCDLLYHCICSDFKLWNYQPDWPLFSQLITNLTFSLIFLPATALLFLSKYPIEKSILAKFFFILKWIVVYMIGEYIFVLTHNMTHSNGWTLWWSLLFYFLMFPMLLLHHTKPKLTYVVSAAVIIFFIFIFKIPIE